MRLFINELCKIKASRSVKGVVIVFLFFALLSGMVFGAGTTSWPVSRYGFGAPFLWLMGNGAAGFFLYAAIVSGLFASEFELGVIANALGSGVKRSSYFIAKVLAVFGACILIYLGGMGILFLIKCQTMGFDPTGKIFADYGLKVLVYKPCAIVSLLSYIAVYIFIACLMREAVPAFIASLVITIAEMLNLFRGPVRIAMDAVAFVRDDTVLSPDFPKLFVPCLCLLTAALGAAYLLFLLQDVD